MAMILHSDGTRESVRFDRILDRVQGQSYELAGVDPVRVSKRVIQGVYDGVTTTALDELAADTAAALSSEHPEYSRLAARIAISRMHKSTSDSIECVFPYMSEDVVSFCRENLNAIDTAIVWGRDFSYDFFGFQTLYRGAYLLRDKTGAVIERPQIMLMRVAVGNNCGDLGATIEAYNELSRGRYTHATPTMFNASTQNPTMASCFLLPISDDSIEGIMETNKKCALISKSAGGIGFSVSNVRAQGSRIKSTGGVSGGILPMLRCFEATARYVDQGGGKRRGAFAAYLEPWHADVRAFLDMKKNHGAEELRARDLFYALWIPDLFMRRVMANENWSLMCPSACPDLVDAYGDQFDALYADYEHKGMVVSTVKAQDLWFAILDAQVETGTPFMLYKDPCNRKSNQKNLGTIRSSNLCTEIVQYSSVDEIAVCNLASIALPSFIEDGVFSHVELARTVDIVTRNLNRVIDRNMYACAQARRSNLMHRPIGIGVQGLADVFARLSMPFDSPEARTLNRLIFETIYFSALRASSALAERDGPYETYVGSPASQGYLQMDLWQQEHVSVTTSGNWNWEELRARIRSHGLRNSLLVAPMPTASTAQILGNNECFEPFTSNIFVRRVLSGEFAVVNKHLVRDLERMGIWDETMRQHIVAADGSVQGIANVPDDIKEKYRTVWEIPMRSIIDMAADRAPFIDQSMSMNLFMANPTHERLSSMHFYAWKKGLKTGMYYLRTRAATDAVKITVSPDVVESAVVCRRNDPDCAACSA